MGPVQRSEPTQCADTTVLDEKGSELQGPFLRSGNGDNWGPFVP